MAYRRLENFSLLMRICIVSVLLCANVSTQERFSFNSEHRHLEGRLIKSLDVDATTPVNGGAIFSVDSYGAQGNGISDDSQAFLAAWNAACASSSSSVFLVPQGKNCLVKPIIFSGPCKTPDMAAQISGRIVAPADPSNWNPQDRTIWLKFSNVQGLTIQGGGIINGSGRKWWEASCKKDPSKAFMVDSSSNVHLRDLTFQNSQQIHVQIYRSTYVQLENMQIVAPGDSPNTDGIHVSASQHVVIQNSTIATGDDCVSIVTGSSDIQINKLICGPGHGISIGSLGKDNAKDVVSDVIVNGASLTGTQNGVRIKTWQGGSGYAQGIVFQHVSMNNVSNPIIIDQYYCDSPTPCHDQISAVQVSNVTYTDITGTSATKEAIKLACSTTVPCTKVAMEGINLHLSNGDTATAFSANVHGSSDGQVIPPVTFLQPIP
eukprot:PITA_28839